LSIADPRLVRFVVKGADVVGFLLAYPNISSGIRKAKGKIWPFGWFHILRDCRTTKWLDFNGIGILPQYQGLGATIVLYAELAKMLEGTRFVWATVNQISEENKRNLRELREFGVEYFDRVHRVYTRPF